MPQRGAPAVEDVPRGDVQHERVPQQPGERRLREPTEPVEGVAEETVDHGALGGGEGGELPAGVAELGQGDVVGVGGVPGRLAVFFVLDVTFDKGLHDVLEGDDTDDGGGFSWVREEFGRVVGPARGEYDHWRSVLTFRTV